MDKARLLIIDDELNFCSLLKKNIEKVAGGEYEVSIATGGADGIRLAKEIKPHLIFIDVLMPGMDGGDVASAIRSDLELKDTPIVFLTAIVREGEAASHKGATVMAKTVTVGDFLACIKRHLS